MGMASTQGYLANSTVGFSGFLTLRADFRVKPLLTPGDRGGGRGFLSIGRAEVTGDIIAVGDWGPPDGLLPPGLADRPCVPGQVIIHTGLFVRDPIIKDLSSLSRSQEVDALQPPGTIALLSEGLGKLGYFSFGV